VVPNFTDETKYLLNIRNNISEKISIVGFGIVVSVPPPGMGDTIISNITVNFVSTLIDTIDGNVVIYPDVFFNIKGSFIGLDFNLIIINMTNNNVSYNLSFDTISI
jgi:hypothetical protein